jgi:DNA-binding NtrC family response regulator
MRRRFPDAHTISLSATIPTVAEQENGWVVLLVESDVVIRNMVRRLLERAGYRVLAAADVIEALTLVWNYPSRVDVLLTDVDMPHLDGISLADYIKSQRPGILVLVMSAWLAYSAPNYEREVTLLPKPFSPQLLLETIRNVILLASGMRSLVPGGGNGQRY